MFRIFKESRPGLVCLMHELSAIQINFTKKKGRPEKFRPPSDCSAKRRNYFARKNLAFPENGMVAGLVAPPTSVNGPVMLAAS
jgi:hypothetical protein